MIFLQRSDCRLQYSLLLLLSETILTFNNCIIGQWCSVVFFAVIRRSQSDFTCGDFKNTLFCGDIAIVSSYIPGAAHYSNFRYYIISFSYICNASFTVTSSLSPSTGNTGVLYVLLVNGFPSYFLLSSCCNHNRGHILLLLQLAFDLSYVIICFFCPLTST